AVFTVVGDVIVARDVGVQLDLVDGRHDVGLGCQPLQVSRLEVRDADGERLAGCLQPFEGPPGRHVEVAARQRPVDEQEVDVVEAEPGQRLLETVDSPILTLERAVEFGDYVKLLAGKAAAYDGSADAQLVAVTHGRVDVAVAGFDG